MTDRAALYCRISRDRVGAGLGVERQEGDCRALAETLGVRIVAVHTDNDLSAYSGKPRPGYRKLLEQVRAGEVDTVLCWHTDRLHRSPTELEEWIDAAQIHGVQVHTVKAGPIDLATPSGRMIARQLGAVARYESEHKAERIAAQKLQAAAAGLYRGGRRPFGYEKDGTTVRPDEAAVVSDVTDRVLAGESLNSIARDLNEHGVRTSTGREWKPTEVRSLLMRARNAGLIERNGEIQAGVTACWPPIVDPDKWRACRRILTAPGRKRPISADRVWLGAGLYECGVCGDGTTMLSASTRSRSRGGDHVPAYRCRAGSHLTRTAAHLDSFVTSVVLARLSRPDARLLLAEEDRRVDIEALHARRDEAEGVMRDLAAMFARREITAGQLAEGTRTGQAELDEIDAMLATATASSPLAGFADADDVAAAWAETTVSRRKAVVRALMRVVLLPAPKGRPKGWTAGAPYFDPESVAITWASS